MKEKTQDLSVEQLPVQESYEEGETKSEAEFAKDGWVVYETVIATDKNGCWFIQIPEFNLGKQTGVSWMPLRTD